MKLNKKIYEDKVRAMWIGKNIGGTMGTPYENTREYLDVKDFKTEKGVTYPNDDLDLQIVWLYAMENLPPETVDCKVLGEMWLSYVTPHWNEYGIGKHNMKRGILPPLSAEYENTWKDSNGAWIRTEIWAALFPGCPELACKYAMEDAKVDHGSGEGTIAAAYVAALESMAFFVSDVRFLIEKALNFIPEESRVSKSVKYAIECYEKGLSPREARDAIQQLNADLGDGWFEAPSNIGYVILGLLYGEGDFKKSMLTAVNCGDDTDCTAATLGSILGIAKGSAGIPSDWSEHIGDAIVTCSIATGAFHDWVNSVPRTIGDLTDRVKVLAERLLVTLDTKTRLTDGESECTDAEIDDMLICRDVVNSLKALDGKSYDVTFGPIKATVTMDRVENILPGEERYVTLKFENAVRVYGNHPYDLRLRWLLPDGFEVKCPHTSFFLHESDSHYRSEVSTKVAVIAPEKLEAVNRLVLEVSVTGRTVVGYVPIIFLA